jgi:uncharacterized OB-fold protein
MSIKFKTGLPATGDLQLLVCGSCGHVNYPARELCGACLSDTLDWQLVDDGGTVQSLTALHYSLESDYADKLPWQVASVKMDCGPVALAHLAPGVSLQDRVILRIMSDQHNNRMLVALGEDRQSATDWLASIEFREDSQ